MSNALCWSTRALYCVDPTLTACVLHASFSPLRSKQSNTSSGVSVTDCSFKLEMLCIVDVHRARMLIHSRRGDRQYVVSQAGIFVNAPSGRALVRRCARLRFGLHPIQVHRAASRDFESEADRLAFR